MKAHFIGIGGIGISAIAQHYLSQNWQVFGSDLEDSEILGLLRKKGAKVFIGQHDKNISKDIDLVVYSLAIQKDNPELKAARKLQVSGFKFQIMSYPEALGELTKHYFTIAISGTHGKSTITTMLGLLLIKAGLSPTVIVGTKVEEFGDSNYWSGKSKYLIIEACEYEESFLNYSPDIAVITNIEIEHIDYFKNFNNIKKAFVKFTKRLKKNGILITENECQKIKEAKKLKKLLKIPGEHNVSNALFALAIARALEIPDKISFKALSEYKGCWRRFEVFKAVINKKEITFVSDYGHHPTEVQFTLKAVREKYPKKKIWCVFQPHQYQRTHYLFDDFVKVFGQALIYKIIITDIYSVAGRESREIKKKVSSEKLVNKIINSQPRTKNNIIYISTIKKVVKYLERNLTGKEVVVIMGAGDIYKLPDYLST